MAQVIWAPRAVNDLQSLLEYISLDSPIRAERFAKKIVTKVESLLTLPDSGSWLPEDDRQIYREIFQGPYRIIYRYEEQTVYVVALHHSARILGDDVLRGT